MRIYTDCFPCFYRSTQEAVNFLNLDDITKIKIYRMVAKQISKFPINATPPEMGYYIHKIIQKITKNPDPYKQIKKKYNDIALSIYEKTKSDILKNSDPLKESVKFAIAGNLIDFGVSANFDFEALLNSLHKIHLNKNHFNKLKIQIKNSSNILYLGDNCGEIVFDKILIEILQKKFHKQVTYVVRNKPIINDVTMDDANYVGLNKICPIITNGANYPGTVLKKTSKKFKKLFFKSDLIIAKGQGNYESLSDINAPIAFLLMAKCEIVARHLNVPQGSFNIKLKS